VAAHIRNSTLRELVRPDGIAGVWCDGREILRRIFVTVRDHRWAEVGPTQWESFLDQAQGTATLKARHVGVHVAFEWEANLRVSPDSRDLRFALIGRALRDMELCRLGLVILHPIDMMVGSRLAATSPGINQTLTVPDLISPQPIVNGLPGAMTEPFSELLIEREDFGALRLRFEGDLFELEDQRNWGDASFKTYCTPLRLGFPRSVKAGTSISQSVEVRFEPACRRHTSDSTEHASASASQSPSARVGRFPTIGRQWPRPSKRVAFNPAEPAWRHFSFEIFTQGDVALLQPLLESVSTKVEIGIGTDLTPTAEILESLSEHGERVARVILYGPNSSPPSTTSVELWRRNLPSTDATHDIPVLAGTRGYFVEFNRARSLDVPASGIAFPLTATVHADDAATIADNVTAIGALAETARNLTGLSQIVVAPLALYFPTSTTGRNFPPDLVQPWLAATLIHAARARVASITLADDVLEAINLNEPRTLQFISSLLECAWREVIPLESPGSANLHAAAFRREEQPPDRILAANLGSQSAAISADEFGLRIESTTDAATGAPLAANDREVSIPAFATAWIELF
jgi:D-apionolactonase